MLRSSREKALFATLVLAAAGLAIFILARKGLSPPAVDGADLDPAPASGAQRINRELPSVPLDVTPEAGAPAVKVEAVAPTHTAGPKCEGCSAQNCSPATSGCDPIESADDRKLCEELYACFTDPANDCLNQGDAVKCWCGTNPTTCLTASSGPARANGPCLDKVFAGARSTDPATIRERFLDPAFPLGRAVSLTGCRGAFCTSECKVP